MYIQSVRILCHTKTFHTVLINRIKETINSEMINNLKVE